MVSILAFLGLWGFDNSVTSKDCLAAQFRAWLVRVRRDETLSGLVESLRSERRGGKDSSCVEMYCWALSLSHSTLNLVLGALGAFGVAWGWCMTGTSLKEETITLCAEVTRGFSFLHIMSTSLSGCPAEQMITCSWLSLEPLPMKR